DHRSRSRGAPRSDAHRQLRDRFGSAARRCSSNARTHSLLDGDRDPDGAPVRDPFDSSMFDPDVLPPREDGLALLANDAIRARRRPLAIALTWAWEALVALIVAWPAASAVQRVYGAHPHGDAALWAPGALDLFSLLVDQTAARASIVVIAAVTLLVASVAGLF